MDQKLLVFLEGIRHSAEITWTAYLRLERLLTWMVDNSEELPNEAYVEAFMDAWAVVDAIDRFRQLWRLCPGLQFEDPPDNQLSFNELAQPVRELRNITDHIATRADEIAASGNPVLGLLTWVTMDQKAPNQGFTCILAPGTMRQVNWRAATPDGRELHPYATGRTCERCSGTGIT